jgi:hypothetical protein
LKNWAIYVLSGSETGNGTGTATVMLQVTKRDGDSSLMQLKEEFRTYENLRREHDTQIVQIATEGEALNKYLYL